jgi:hypothetical protein
MKTMTCRELGGECDKAFTTETPREMVEAMTAHVISEHPDTAKAMERMHNEDPDKWGKEFKRKWEATPED